MKAKNKKSKATKRPYWVRYCHGECPVCGRDKSYRERVYDEPKPADADKRHVQRPDQRTYCGCLN